MFKFGMKSDTIQFWLLVLTGVGMLISFAGWADARYFKADQGKRLQREVHAIYMKELSPQERAAVESALEAESQ